ncbi:MAG: molybdopterin-binding protein, partial [Cyclobacteriaceae bacterium]
MKIIKAEILTIGDEILYGQIVDTNSRWMGERLAEEGIRVIWKTTVGDREADIMEAFEQAQK